MKRGAKSSSQGDGKTAARNQESGEWTLGTTAVQKKGLGAELRKKLWQQSERNLSQLRKDLKLSRKNVSLTGKVNQINREVRHHEKRNHLI